MKEMEEQCENVKVTLYYNLKFEQLLTQKTNNKQAL
jgi:hypothetical protein